MRCVCRLRQGARRVFRSIWRRTRYPGRSAPGVKLAADGSRRLSDSLGGARVGLLEARMESELASLVRRHGGEPVCAPALREVERDCVDEARRAVDSAHCSGAVVVLATGVGLARWLPVA